MGFLGYQKDEIREYNDKRCCGLWFIIIGVTILLLRFTFHGFLLKKIEKSLCHSLDRSSCSDFVQLQFVEERDKSILISGEFTVAFLSKTAYNVSRNILLLSTVTERVLSMPITK